jgi:hypothetical protein
LIYQFRPSRVGAFSAEPDIFTEACVVLERSKMFSRI